MIILGIETSCDETAAAVVKNGTEILSSIIASSVEMHKKTGGIIPEQAARQQIVSIIPVIETAIKDSGVPKDAIDQIAVTYGPGLIGSLLVGVETAKTLSYAWNKPIVPINHLVGHIYASWLTESKKPVFPALALVVSGGHTDLVFMKGHGQIKWVGGTRDDAAGEAFDKTARLLGLPYPGGPAISRAAEKYLKSNPVAILDMFPRPMIDRNNFDCSFSGLKTAVLTKVGTLNKSKPISKKKVEQLSAEVQEAIVDVLVTKTINAVEKYKPKSLLVTGGVAANKRLKEKFESEINSNDLNAKLFIPPPSLCTDNAAYVASAAYFNNNPINWKSVSANPELSISD